MHEYTLPKLGHLMEEGTIVAWKKKPGEAVSRGEPIVEIEVDKGTLEAESDVTGTVVELLVEEGQTVPVNTPIARIQTA